MKLIAIVAFLCIVVASGLTVAGVVSSPFFWMDCLFLARVRPRLAVTRLCTIVLAIWLLASVILPLGEGTILGFILALSASPWFAKRWIVSSAWRADDAETRKAARRLRQDISRRAGIARNIAENHPWPEYVFDVERARHANRFLAQQI